MATLVAQEDNPGAQEDNPGFVANFRDRTPEARAFSDQVFSVEI
jgi:hypothetical protein